MHFSQCILDALIPKCTLLSFILIHLYKKIKRKLINLVNFLYHNCAFSLYLSYTLCTKKCFHDSRTFSLYSSSASRRRFVTSPPIRPVSLEDKDFHPSASTLSNSPSSSAISYLSFSSGVISLKFIFFSFLDIHLPLSFSKGLPHELIFIQKKTAFFMQPPVSYYFLFFEGLLPP